MAWQAQQMHPPTSTPTLNSVEHFANALKLLLDEGNTMTLALLASRISPFRIIFQDSTIENGQVSKLPMLVLTDVLSQGLESPISMHPSCFSPGKTTSYFAHQDTAHTAFRHGGDVLTTNMPIGTPALDPAETAELANLSTATYLGPYDYSGLDTESLMEPTECNSCAAPNMTQADFEGTQWSDAQMPNYDITRASSIAMGISSSPTHTVLVEGDSSHGYDQFAIGRPINASADRACRSDSVADGSPKFNMRRSPVRKAAHHSRVQRRTGMLTRRLSVSDNGPPQELESDIESSTPEDSREVISAREALQHTGNSPPSQSDALWLANMATMCIRPNHLEFLETRLSRWCREGLWENETLVNTTETPHEHEKLHKAYSFVCFLDSRMNDDAIRSRMAMVLLYLEFEKSCQDRKSTNAIESKARTRIGRGYISTMIDNILDHTHHEWSTASNAEKAAMRANFHSQKRYGKRWWTLVRALGYSILVLCSSTFAVMIKNTTITAATLEEIARTIQSSEFEHLMATLKLVNPIAKSLCLNQEFRDYDAKKLLEQIRGLTLQEKET